MRMIETRAGDVATREAFQLAELFQKMVEDHKVGKQEEVAKIIRKDLYRLELLCWISL